MDTDVPIVAIFVGAGLLGYAVIFSLLVMWNRVLDHVHRSGNEKKQG